jgi:hypothetical protein
VEEKLDGANCAISFSAGGADPERTVAETDGAEGLADPEALYADI